MSTRSGTTFGIRALFLAMALLMLGNGLQASLIGIRTQLEGFSGFTTGIVMAAYFAGFLGGSFLVPRFVIRVGHIRVFAALASGASAAALAYSISGDPFTWAAMRFITGVCFAGLYVVAESWIHSRATNETRGRLMATYMVTVLGAAGLGQFLLNVSDPAGFELFILTSILISMAVVPVSLARSPAPEFESEHPASLTELAKRSPLGVVAGLLTGASNAAILGMGAVYGITVGMSTFDIALFIAAALAGGVILQWPLGILSDRMPRRAVILGVSIASTATAVVAASQIPASPTMMALAFLYGGFAFSMYSLSISYINDTTPSHEFVGAAAAFLFVSGIGAIAGPLAVSWAMDEVGAEGYWWSLAAFYAPVAGLALYRILIRARYKEQRFVPVPHRTSPVIGSIIEDYEAEPEE